MTNAELIKALRYCISENAYDCDLCPYQSDCKSNGTGQGKMIRDAADALEAADKRIDGLQKLVDINTERCEALRKQLRESHESYERHIAEQQEQIAKLYILLNNRINEIAELEAQLPKEGEWIWENYCWHCSVCGENPTRGMGYVQGKNELFKVCPNCGARMIGEQ